MPASSPPQATARRTGSVKSVLGRRVVDGGDSGWWRALIPALAVLAVLFAALNVRDATRDAGQALDRAADAREVAASVDRVALLGRASLGENGRARAADLAAARGSVLTRTSDLGRETGDGDSAADLARQAAASDRALDAALAPGASRAEVRRAASSLTSLQPAARAVSDRLDMAADRADDRAARQLTWTLIGVLLLVTLLLGSFWSRRNAADALRRERRFRALLHNSSDLVVVVDPGTLAIRYATPAVERMLGYAARGGAGLVAGRADPPRGPRRARGRRARRAPQRRRPRDRPLAGPAPCRRLCGRGGQLARPDRRSVGPGPGGDRPRRGRAHRPGGPAAPPGLPRPAHRAAQPVPVRGPGAPRGGPHPAPRARRWPCCSWTWTTSRP